MKIRGVQWLVWLALGAVAQGALAYEKVKDGGSLGNSYSSQMARVNDNTMRITMRKKIAGDPEEINKPGTSMANAFNAVINAATVRAAVEAKELGYSMVKVEGSRNLTQVQEKRAASQGPVNAREFTFASGYYHDDVELAIEIVVRCVEGELPDPKPSEYIDVNAVLKAYGL